MMMKKSKKNTKINGLSQLTPGSEATVAKDGKWVGITAEGLNEILAKDPTGFYFQVKKKIAR